MILPLEIRNRVVFRKVVRIVNHTMFNTLTAKFWNVHSPNFLPENMDQIQSMLSLSLLAGQIDLLDVIDHVHRESPDTIFDDPALTKTFINVLNERFNNDN